MRARRVAEACVLAALVFYWLYFATRMRWVWTPADFLQPWMTDFSILMTSSAEIAARGHYPDLARPGVPGFFPYAPPAVVLFILFGALGPAIATPLFLLAKLAALGAILWAGLRLAGATQRAERAAIAVIAVIAADPWISSDLRQQNINVIYVALVALAAAALARPARAGVLLAFATAFKLYSAVLLPWLALTRRWRATVVMALALVGFFVVLPIAWFGVEMTARLYGEWFAQLRASGTRAIHDSPGPWITLRRFLSLSSGADPFADAVAWGIVVLQGAWIAVLAGYAWTTRHADRTVPAAIGADAVVLMLAPLPFSTVLQPTHGSPLLLAHVLLAAAALDRGRPLPIRLLCGFAMLGAVILQAVLRAWAWRGGVFLVVISLTVAALAATLRPRALAR